MRYTQYFSDRNSMLLATTGRDDYFLHGELVSPFSEMMYCDTCGEVFGRAAVIENSSNKVMPWVASRLRCSNCPSSQVQFQWSGSMLLSWDKEYVKNFPEEMWKREAKIHTEIFDKLQQEVLI